ncbi:MAG: serine/threonine-protein kinase [Acidobacteriota bacterium]
MTRETTEEVTRKRWKQALDHLDQALLLAPTEREQLLNSLGQQDAELRRTVSQLLDANSNNESGNFMESPPWSYQPIESNPQLLVGKRIGAYRLTQYLAKGGMGIVYLAERADKAFRRQVAVKIINADPGLNHYQRFRREVQILADLNHPNLVLLYDAGRMGDRRPYLVMEYVEGETLRDWLIQRGPMTPEQVIAVIKQASAGLHAAHEKGVIHRDIKPANIAVIESGGKLTVKVLDFGIAARKSHDGISISRTEGVLGTPLYMSPEQLQGKSRDELTRASDIYALGLTAYELLTGQPAINGGSQTEIIARHLYNQPVPPSQLRPDLKIPAAVDRVVMKALAKDPNDRYQNAPEFAVELEATLRGDKRSDEKSGYAKAAAAVVAVGIVTVASYFIWQRKPVTPQPPPQIVASPSPASSPQARKLKLLLKAENVKGEPLAKSSFALFNEGITVVPDIISEENALTLRTDSQGRAETEQAAVKPGTYLMKAVRVGYKSFIGNVTLGEDRARPGTVTLVVTLEPE